MRHILAASLVFIAGGASAQVAASADPSSLEAQIGNEQTGDCRRVLIRDNTEAGTDNQVSVGCIEAGTGRVQPPVYAKRTYGQYENAAVLSLIGNSPDPHARPGVLGAADPFAYYGDRDGVTLYAEMSLPPIAFTAAPTGFTATSAIFGNALAPTQRDQLRVGMVVDIGTAIGTRLSGFITGWAADGRSINVRNWMQLGHPEAGQIPAVSQTAYFNPQNKGWVANFNCVVRVWSFGKNCVGIETGVVSDNTDSDPYDGDTPQIWGYDAVNLGAKRAGVGFYVRGQVPGFHSGVIVDDTTFAGYTVGGTNVMPQYGYLSKQTSGEAFAVSPNAAGLTFAVGANGTVRTAGSMSIGKITAPDAALDVAGSIIARGERLTNLHVHADNAAAMQDGDPAGMIYRTANGVLMVRY